MSNLAANIESVYRRIEAAAGRAGRRADEITLVAVTKTHPPETVIAAYRAGLRHFGENRVEEAGPKIAAVQDWLDTQPDFVDTPPVWHLIGHLQSRKAGQALGRYRLIHSVDSLKLAQRLNRLALRDNYPPQELLLECNVSGEATKAGFALHHWAANPAQLEAFLEAVAQIECLEKIKIRGLMTMAPLSTNPEDARPTFRSLAGLRDRLQARMPGTDWSHLSMGMTDDFEVAIEEGATIIRVGRALFGERP